MSKYNRRLLRRSIQEQIEARQQDYIDGIEYVQYPGSWERFSKPTKTCFRIDTVDGKDAVIDFTSQETFDASLDALPEECYAGLASKQEVFQAICAEREYQDEKWGAHKPLSLPGFLLVIERELQEAKEGWLKNHTGRNAPLNELVQVAATCFAALERYGVTGSTHNVNDDPNPQ